MKTKCKLRAVVAGSIEQPGSVYVSNKSRDVDWLTPISHHEDPDLTSEKFATYYPEADIDLCRDDFEYVTGIKVKAGMTFNITIEVDGEML